MQASRNDRRARTKKGPQGWDPISYLGAEKEISFQRGTPENGI
jgi:hypothetical protein